ncbi:hypothetical protein LZ31DRAFT_475695, partial [Colletotrichum somersetense]
GVDAWSRSTPLGSHFGRDKTSSTYAICHLPSYLIPSRHVICLSIHPSACIQHPSVSTHHPLPSLAQQSSLTQWGGGGAILVNLGIIPLALARVAPTLPSSPRNLTKIK